MMVLGWYVAGYWDNILMLIELLGSIRNVCWAILGWYIDGTMMVAAGR